MIVETASAGTAGVAVRVEVGWGGDRGRGRSLAVSIPGIAAGHPLSWKQC